MMSHDVVVVGAGLAGLAAALRLREKGHEPLVLERSDGPGGRVRTDIVDGFRLDRGFQTLYTAFPEAQRLLDYEALDLRAFERGAILRIDGTFHRIAPATGRPADAISTMRVPIGSMADKLAFVKFRRSVRNGDPDDLFSRKEVTARARLEEAGVSDRMIDRFLGPMFAGISHDPSFSFSSRYLEFMFRMITDGDVAVPAEGMGVIADQLIAGLPAGSVRCGVEVTAVEADHVIADDSRVDASAVVVAVDAAEAVVLTHGEVEDRGHSRITTRWFAAPEPPQKRPVMVFGEPNSAINSLAVMSQVSDRYSSDGRALVAASTPGDSVTDEDVIRCLKEWYGSMTDDWEPLRVDRIDRAKPVAVGVDPDQTVRLASGLFVAGNYRQNPSINGALQSGRRAGEAVAARLCRDC